ncbi:MAG: CapA family protein [Bacillota bacterium]|nr:CapA family protein [Bacillota bacterium]
MINKLTKILIVLIACVSVLLGFLWFKYQEPDSNAIRVTCTGDIYYDLNFTGWIEENAFEDYFEPIQPLLKSDLTIGNLVQTIGTSDATKENEEGEKEITEFPNSYLETLTTAYKGLGFDFFTCANMQSRRKGREAINHTLDVLDENKLGHTGINRSQEEQETIAIKKARDAKVAILSYTTKVYDSAVYEEDYDEEITYDVNVILDEDGNFDMAHKKKIKQDVAYAKEKADVVLVAMNWGNEYTYNIDQNQIVITNYLNSLGVDMIIGNHPHISQKADVLTNANGEKTYVFYSLGSLINAGYAKPGDVVDETGVNMAQASSVVTFELVPGEEGYEMDNVKVIPVINHYEKGYDNFQLIPLREYTDTQASKHAQSKYSANFNTRWFWEQYHALYDTYKLLSEERVNAEKE